MGLKTQIVQKWEEDAEFLQVKGLVVYRSPVRCPANEPPVPEGWKSYCCGGAYPTYLVYDPKSVAIDWLSAPQCNHLEEITAGLGKRFIGVFAASVHGCSKLKKNQLVIARKRG